MRRATGNISRGLTTTGHGAGGGRGRVAHQLAPRDELAAAPMPAVAPPATRDHRKLLGGGGGSLLRRDVVPHHLLEGSRGYAAGYKGAPPAQAELVGLIRNAQSVGEILFLEEKLSLEEKKNAGQEEGVGGGDVGKDEGGDVGKDEGVKGGDAGFAVDRSGEAGKEEGAR